MDTRAGTHPPTPARIDAASAAWLVDAIAPGSRPATWRAGAGIPDGLVAAAQFHGVEGWLRHRALTAGLVVPGVDVAVHAALGRHQRALADLARVHAALEPAGVEWLVVKGPAVTRWYAEPSLRSYVDLDVVVAPTRLGTALDSLEAAGFELLDANWPLLRSADVHELALRTPSGGALDLHWSLGPSPMSIDHSPTVEVLLGRAAAFEVGAVVVQGLADADALVHLAVHAAASGGHRLVWLTDLRAAIAATGPEPSALSRAGAEWGAGSALDLMLGRLRRTLGDARTLPYERSSWRPWSLVGQAAWRLSPPETTGAGGSLGRLVARSSRHSSAASLRALASKAAARSMGAGPDLSPAVLADPTSPTSARHPVGGAAGRAEFVSWVRDRRR